MIDRCYFLSPPNKQDKDEADKQIVVHLKYVGAYSSRRFDWKDVANIIGVTQRSLRCKLIQRTI